MDDNLCCPISLDLFVDPVQLPCGHTFSRQSLIDCDFADTRCCPLCRAEHADFDVFTAPRNFAVATLVEAASGQAPTASPQPDSTLPSGNDASLPLWSARLRLLEGGKWPRPFGQLKVDYNGPPLARTLLLAVVDRSGSMADAMTQVHYSLVRAAEFSRSNPSLKTIVISYDDKVDILPIDPTIPAAVVEASIRAIHARGGTSFREAFSSGILPALRADAQNDGVSNAVVLFLTDGQDGSGIKTSLTSRQLHQQVRSAWSKPLTFHCVGFTNNHDYDILQQITKLGTTEGAYRFADPAESLDALSSKINSIFDVVASNMLPPVRVVSLPGLSVVAMNGSTESITNLTDSKLWVQIVQDKVDGDDVIVLQPPLRVDPIRIPLVRESTDDPLLWKELHAYLVDEIATELFRLTDGAGAGSGTATGLSVEAKELHFVLLQQRGRALLARLDDDDPTRERLTILLGTLSTVRSGGTVDRRKLDDMRQEGRFATTATTGAPSAKAKASDVLQVTKNAASSLISANRAKVSLPHYVRRSGPRVDQSTEFGRLLATKSNQVILNWVDQQSDSLLQNQRDSDGNGVVAMAALVGRISILEDLVARFSGDPDALKVRNRYGESALDLALVYGYDRSAKLLFSHHANATFDGQLLLATALRGHTYLNETTSKNETHKYIRTADLLLEQGASVLTEDFESLCDTMESLTWYMANQGRGATPATRALLALGKGFFSLLEPVVDSLPSRLSWEKCLHLVEKPSAEHSKIINLLLSKKVLDPDEIVTGPIDPDDGVPTTTSALFVAAEKGNLPVVQALIKQSRALVNWQNHKGTTALWIACCKNHFDVVRALMRAGADVNLANVKGDTALVCACQMGHEQIVDALLVADAKWNLFNRNRDNPIIIACRTGQDACLSSILNSISDPADKRDALSQCADIDGLNPLLAAVETDKHRCVRTCLMHGADINFRTSDNNPILPGANALHLAAWYGRLQAARVLCEFGIDVNAQTIGSQWTALRIAVVKGHASFAEFLLREQHADPTIVDSDGRNVPFYARASKSEQIRELLTNPLEPVLFSWLVSPDGIRQQCTDVIRRFGQSLGYFDVNTIAATSIAGAPLVTRAMQYRIADIVNLFSSLSVDLSISDQEGLPALFWAKYCGYSNVPELSTSVPLEAKVSKLLENVDNARRFGEDVIQNKMLTDLSKGTAKPALLDESEESGLKLRMSDGVSVKVSEEVRLTLLTETAHDDHSLIGLLAHLQKQKSSNTSVSGRNNQMQAILHEAKIHVVSRLATGEAHLQPIHLLALYLFTALPYISTTVHRALADWDSVSSEWHNYVFSLHRALSLLPPFEGEVYRAIPNVDVASYLKLVVGDTITWDSFSVCSSDWSHTYGVASESKQGLAFILHSCSGRRVAQYSSNPVDNEVVFLPGTRFKLLNVYRGAVFVFGQKNIRHTYIAEENDFEKALKGKTCLIMELQELPSDS